MYERILFPTDGSVGTVHVALQAIDLAEQYGATIHVLHVVDEDLRSQLSELAGVGQELETRGQQAVERIEHMARAHDVDTVTAIEEGDPASVIVAYAEDIETDLIVAGTHGRSGIERRLLGSVAERVVREAPCPVLTVGLSDTDVTVDDEAHAREIAREALENNDVEATVTGVERQVNVWVVEADEDEASFLTYVDPATKRASVIKRERSQET